MLTPVGTQECCGDGTETHNHSRLLGTHNWTFQHLQGLSLLRHHGSSPFSTVFRPLIWSAFLAQTLHKLISIHSDEKLQLDIFVKIKLHFCRITWLCPTEFRNLGHSRLGYKTMQSCRWLSGNLLPPLSCVRTKMITKLVFTARILKCLTMNISCSQEKPESC